MNKLEEAAEKDTAMYSNANDAISGETRAEIARIGGCIRALVEGGVKVEEETVRRAYEASLELDEMEGENSYLGGERGRSIVEGVLAGR